VLKILQDGIVIQIISKKNVLDKHYFLAILCNLLIINNFYLFSHYQHLCKAQKVSDRMESWLL